ncbi:MAG: sigma factor regulatory protein FecR [Myxococcaceae bacterium]|nr:sigma factor regulatory protein FecR [Myxococcaceae bacterium]
MAVTRGDGQLGDQALAIGERGTSAAGGTQLQPQWPVTLVEPARNQRRFFRDQAPAVTFRWQPAPEEARLQIARDRGFAFVLEERSGAEGTFVLGKGGAGVFWWRLVDEEGEPVSEARRFTVLEDVPPTLLSPREGEVMLSDEKNLTVFSWVGVRGVSRYKLELSDAPNFATLAWEREVEGSQLRTPLTLAEGRWFWRVRTIAEERGESGPSAPRAFRLIHRALPQAPELLNPEIEVEPARGK